MKVSLKSVLAVLALGLAVSPVVSLAQDTPPAEKRPPGGGGGGARMGPEQMIARLDEAVTLTGDQKTKITEIYKKQAAAMQEIPQEERREKGMEMMTKTRGEIRALLTSEQQTKFDAMPQRGQGGQGGQGGPGGGGKKKDKQ